MSYTTAIIQVQTALLRVAHYTHHKIFIVYHINYAGEDGPYYLKVLQLLAQGEVESAIILLLSPAILTNSTLVPVCMVDDLKIQSEDSLAYIHPLSSSLSIQDGRTFGL